MTVSLNPFADSILTHTELDEADTASNKKHPDQSDCENNKIAPKFLRSLVTTGEGEMARNRLFISAAILIYFVFETVLLGNKLFLPLFIISSFFLFSCVLSWHIRASPEPNHARRMIALVGDTGTLSIGLIIGGPVTAFTFPIYLWIIFGNGFRFGIRYLTYSSVISALMFLAVIAISPYWNKFYNLDFGLLISLIIIPLYSRKLIRDLSNARKKAENANEMKTVFLASVSHELRTPLNAIIGLSDLLSSTKLSHDQREMTTAINVSGQSLCNLIDNFLDYSRLEAGAMPTCERPFALMSLMSEVESVAHTHARRKDISTSLHVTPRTPLNVIGDRSKLLQILTNLASNAVKFTERGSVCISVDALQGSETETKCRFRFEVTDTGIGISDDAKQHIFERFRQAEARIVDQYGGTGLGLAIVKQLVTLLDGAIGVVSQPSKGSMFWVELDLEIDHTTCVEDQENTEGLQVAVFTHDAFYTRTVMKAADHRKTKELFTDAEAARWISETRRSASDAVLILDERVLNRPSLLTNHISSNPLQIIVLTTDDTSGLAHPTVRRSAFSRIRKTTLNQDLQHALAALRDRLKYRNDCSEIIEKKHEHTGLSILVAEDNHANQMVIEKLLRHAGHAPVVVGDGDETLDALTERHFDAVLLDLNMPRVNGFEAIKLIHFSLFDQDVPILALTADASAATAEKCRKAGFDACITKPYNAKHLLETIEALLKVKSPSSPRQTTKQSAALGCATDTQTDAHQADDAASMRNSGNEFEQTNPELDLERLKMLEGLGSADFFNELITEFDHEARRILQSLHQSVLERDNDETRKQAHALKSSAVNLGAIELADMCSDLELSDGAALNGRGLSRINELRAQYESTYRALQKHAARNGNSHSTHLSEVRQDVH